MTSLIYSTGTVSVTNGSAVVTGNGTGWAVALIRYGLFSCAGLSIPIASVESDTSLTLAYDWPGTSGAEKPYALYLNSDHAGNAVWTNRLITDVIKNLALVGIHPDGAGTLAERDALDPVPATGFIWLYVESGYDLAIYRKTDSGWDGPFAVRGGKGDTGETGPAGEGFNLAGEWDNSTSYDANDTVWFGGRTFASKVDGNVGNEPPDADEDDEYWQFVPAAQGAKGDKGDKGDKGEKGDTGPAWDGWQGEWVTSTAYEKLDTVERGGSSYICTSAHTSGSTTEPGVGADWQTVWDLVAAKGQDGAGTGDVVGPASSTDGEVALFDGVTGKLIKGGGALGTAAFVDSGDFATAAQGAKADSAVQPADLADVATSGDYNDLDNRPTLGSAAAEDTSAFATAAQGAKADTALQPDEDADLAAGFTATSKSLGNLGSAVTISPADGNIQHGTNNAAVTITAPSVAGVYTIIVEIVNSATAGAVTLAGFTKTDGDAFTTTNGHKFQLHIAKTNSAVTATVKALQ